MKLFLDTADIDEIRTAARWGILDGVTTNPTLYAKVGGASYDAILQEICKITPGPVLIMATFVGYRVAGILGALFSTLCVFLPSFLMTITAGSSFRRFRANRQMQAFLRGVAPAVTGLLAAAAWSVARAGIHTIIGGSMALIILVILLRWRPNIFWVLIGAGVFRFTLALVVG